MENILNNINISAVEIMRFIYLLSHLFFGKLTPSEAAGEIVLSEEGRIAG